MNNKNESIITIYNNMDEFHKVEGKNPARKWESESLYNKVSLQIQLIYNARSLRILLSIGYSSVGKEGIF